MNQSEPLINELITGYLTGELSSGELQMLQSWVAASDANKCYFDEMKVTWQVAGSLDTSVAFNSEKAWRKVSTPKVYSNRKKVRMNLVSPKARRMIKRTLQTAAILIVVFLGGGASIYLLLRPEFEKAKEAVNLSEAEYQIEIPLGARSDIRLPDGTKVQVNAGSKLTYTANYGISTREITLNGEAYFDVATNPDKPFTVHTSDLDILAFGTAFNVKAYPEDDMIATTLEHGEIKIKNRSRNLDLLVHPGQHVVFYKLEDEPLTVNHVNTEFYTSWKDPKWLIESQTFGELAVSLERKYNIRIIFSSPELKHYSFSGTFHNETIEQVLNVLAITAPLKYSINQGSVKLTIDRNRKHNYDALSTIK